MEKLTLKALPRDLVGSKVKQLKNNGQIPAVIYGRGFENINLVLDGKEFNKLYTETGSSTIINLKVEDKDYNVLIHEPQKDPVSDKNIHVDFYKVDMTQELQTEIPLEFIGVSLAVTDLEGNLITNKDALEVKCLPDKLVSQIEVDISVLKTFEDVIKVSDIKIPEGIEILNDLEEIIAQVTAPRSEAELEEMETTAADSEKAQIETIEAQADAEKAEKAEGEEEEAPTKEQAKKE